MADLPIGLSFEQTDDALVLRRRDVDGSVVAINLSVQEALGLKGTIDLWSGRITSRRLPETAAIESISAHPIEKVRVVLDALQENLLFTITTLSGEKTTLAFPRETAGYAASEVQKLLGERNPSNMTKQ